MKSDRELAEELDKLQGTEKEAKFLQGPRVDAAGTRHPRAVLSLRMSSEELSVIEKCAAGAGKNVSEFIRESALQRSESQSPWQAMIGVYVRALLAEVRAIEESLDGIWDALEPSFQVAPQTAEGPERVARGYRDQVNARLDELVAKRRSLEEFWDKTA